MESALKTILQYKLFKKGDTVAVAVSGGIDSMCLLNFLNEKKDQLGIKLVSVNIDHSIRKESADECKFVADFCKSIGVSYYKFKVDVPKLATDQKLGIEESARIARYKIFESVVKKGLANKIAIAHHQSDQAETVLLNIFRGAGLKGASGMDVIQGIYVRPFLNTSKTEILQYAQQKGIEHVQDASNFDNEYSRNFLRNQIMPMLKSKWKNVENNILNFANICKQDDDYITSTIDFDDIEITDTYAKIPLYKFAHDETIQNRILRYCFSKLQVSKDVEKRHLTILKNLVSDGKNGSKLNLPNKVKASLEYDELVLSLPKKQADFVQKDFKTGMTNFEKFSINVKKTAKFDKFSPDFHIIDAKKLPADVKWRARENGDMFAKFGSGEKKLKDYFIDIKVPNSQRDKIPVLASGNQIYCVLGHEISGKVKIDENTKTAYLIEYKKIEN